MRKVLKGCGLAIRRCKFRTLKTAGARYSPRVRWRKSPPSTTGRGKHQPRVGRARELVLTSCLRATLAAVGLFEQRADQSSNSIIRLKEAEHESDCSLHS